MRDYFGDTNFHQLAALSASPPAPYIFSTSTATKPKVTDYKFVAPSPFLVDLSKVGSEVSKENPLAIVTANIQGDEQEIVFMIVDGYYAEKFAVLLDYSYSLVEKFVVLDGLRVDTIAQSSHMYLMLENRKQIGLVIELVKFLKTAPWPVEYKRETRVSVKFLSI